VTNSTDASRTLIYEFFQRPPKFVLFKKHTGTITITPRDQSYLGTVAPQYSHCQRTQRTERFTHNGKHIPPAKITIQTKRKHALNITDKCVARYNIQSPPDCIRWHFQLTNYGQIYQSKTITSKNQKKHSNAKGKLLPTPPWNHRPPNLPMMSYQ